MKRWLTWPKHLFYALVLLFGAAYYVPKISAARYREPIRAGLENALGRKVEIGEVMFQLLPPRVQYHQHPDPRSQVLGIGRHLQKGLLGALEEKPIHQLAVAQGQRAELVGQGEDDVEVRNRQELGLTFGQPRSPLAATALRTASVATGMIVVSHLATMIALADVPAQGVRAAERQVPKCLADMRTLGPTLQEFGSILPHDLTQG